MIFEEDEDIVQDMIRVLKVAFSRDTKERTGIHVSDLVYCLRKAWYRRQEDFKEDLDNNSILFFVRGRSLHDLLEKLYAQREVRVKYNGVKGTIDAITHDNQIVEIKTTKKLWKDQPNDHHLKQIAYYMAMYGTNRGVLLYYEIQDNNLRYFEIYMDDEELMDECIEIDTKKAILDKALEHGDVDICGESPRYDWECKFCDIDECPNNRRKK